MNNHWKGLYLIWLIFFCNFISSEFLGGMSFGIPSIQNKKHVSQLDAYDLKEVKIFTLFVVVSTFCECFFNECSHNLRIYF